VYIAEFSGDDLMEFFTVYIILALYTECST